VQNYISNAAQGCERKGKYARAWGRERRGSCQQYSQRRNNPAQHRPSHCE
jgi:hypothetical protein